MEIIDRPTVFARIRSQRPKFSAKPLKAIIAANPSLGAQRLKSNRGSKYGYPAELVDVAIAYVDSAAVKRFSGPRNVLTWLSRSQVSPSENRVMIDTELKPFLEALDRAGILLGPSIEFKQTVEKYINERPTAQERDLAHIASTFIINGTATFLPKKAIRRLQTVSLNLAGSEANEARLEEKRDILLEAATVSVPGFFADLPETLGNLSALEIEDARLVTAKAWKLVTFIMGDAADDVAQYGKLNGVLQGREPFASFNNQKKALMFVTFAMIRPFFKKNFDTIVKALPLFVPLLAIMRSQFPLEEQFSEILTFEIPASWSKNKAFAPKPLS